MVTIVSNGPVSSETDEALEQPKQRIPLMSIPVILAVGLVVAVGYVAVRVVQSRPHATAVVAQKRTETTAVNRQIAPVPVQAASEKPAETPPAPEIATPAVPGDTAAVPSAISGPKEETPAAQEDADSGLISPQHGQRYLQIAAISARYSQTFLAEVSRYNVQARVAPGPNEDLVRVVIGPFSDHESLVAAKAQIQVMWPDCFVRVY
jgi:cell division protein FtsN